MGPRRRAIARSLMMMVAWVIATTVAGAGEWAVVSHLAGQGTATAALPLSRSEVSQRLAQATPVEAGAPAGRRRTRSAPSPAPPVRDRASSPPKRQPAAQTARSWQVTGGSVGTSCRGPVINLVYASPLDGWTYRLDTQTPTRVSLEFSRGPQTAGLTARCLNGVPTRVVGVAHDHETGNEGGSGD